MYRWSSVAVLTVLIAGSGACGSNGAGAGGDAGSSGAGGSAGGAGGAEGAQASVRIAAPEHGAFVDEGTRTLEVTGTVSGLDAGVSDVSLRVNGQAVSFDDDGRWSTTVSLDGSSVPQSIGAVLDGGSAGLSYDRIVVMRGTSIAKGTRAPESAFIQMTDAGLDAIEPVALELLPIDFAAAVPEGAEVLPEGSCVLPFGDACLLSASAVVSGETQVNGDITVAIDAQTNAVRLDMSVSQISVPIDLSTSIGVDCTVTATLGTLRIDGAFELDPATEDPALVDVVQVEEPPLSATQDEVEILAESCNNDALTPLINLLAGAFVPLVQSGLESFLNTELPDTDDTPIAGALEDAMATIQVAAPVGEAIEAEVDGIFRAISETDGDVLLIADTDFRPMCAAVEGAPALDRSLAPPFSPAPLPLTTPVSGLEHHIALAITPAGFNQILRTLTECGLLVADIEELPLGSASNPLTTQLIGLIVPALLEQFGASEPVRVELRPTIAPFVTGAPGPNGELLELVLPHLRVDFILPDAGDLLALSIAVDIESQGIDLAPSEAGNALGFVLAAPDASNIGVSMLDNPFGADLETIQELLPTFLPGFLDAVVSDLPGLEIPGFAGLTLSPVEVSLSSGAIGIFTMGAP